MKYLLSYLIIFALNLPNLHAQTVSCSIDEIDPTFRVTIINSTPNGANDDYTVTFEVFETL